ncbi:hypothetical protein G7Y89_g2337 [Cudoniella acicularis]|uniref:ubiquitinyl hydrolase 1 n=1 Tax=Cudoniella acicularis TaxID=354080 RepID=A0A8H4RWG7_9HELO|nr:hypothetical protein G7Y89_g2337 [Cudoniella acicularis]
MQMTTSCISKAAADVEELTFTTSSTKKRKLSPQHIQGQDSDNNPDTPLKSVEDCGPQASRDHLRFDAPDSDAVFHSQPPSFAQRSSSLGAFDYTSSAASSPSAAYAGLSIDGERRGISAAPHRAASLAPNEYDTNRSQSPIGTFARKAIMGGAADLPQRSSSPLKRRASDLEESDAPSSQKDDIEMVSAPSSDPPDATEGLKNVKRNQSVDMLGNGAEVDSASTSTDQEQSTAATTQSDNDVPSIDSQIKTVTTLCEAAAQRIPEEGEKMYLVSKRWLNRVQDRGSEARKHSKIEPEGEIGPVDNSDIIQQIIKDANGDDFVQLKIGYAFDQFILCPEDAWRLVVEWYGLMPGSIPIVRYAHNTNPDKTGVPNMSFELHPPIFTIHRLWSEHSGILIPQKLKVSNPPAPIFVFSRSARYYDFLKKIKEKSETEPSRKVRIWRVPQLLPAADPVAPAVSAVTPPSSRPGSPAPAQVAPPRGPQDSWTQLLLDVPTFLQLEKDNGRELVGQINGQRDISTDPNYNGSSDLLFTGLGDSQTIVIDEATDGNNFVSNQTAKPYSKITSSAMTRTGVSQSAPNSGRNSPNPLGPMTRGRAQKTGRAYGTVGLSNLGNTCYMNSALQCVRSVEELTKYFLTGAAKSELNKENPLGNHGEVALAYERLLEEIYREPVPTSVAPRNFKNTIGRFAPSFSGYGQQDSQEFLGFLLDGLQEDLSRVKKKPYIEKPDSTDDMVNNPEAIRQMAAQVWDITKKRDDSVIADLFTGMYKSTLVCPVCSKVSITFDPFNNLTLQLPIENSWSHQLYYFPLNDAPVIINVDMDKQGSILALKEFVSKRVDVPVERLFAAEEFKSKFYKIYSDFNVASEEIQSNDVVAMYELEAKPTNWPPQRKSAKKGKAKSMLSFGQDEEEDDIPKDYDDPMADKMLVPVFHRRPNPDKHSRYKKNWALVPAPHFIVVTREEARDLNSINRKVLEKVATFTTYPAFHEDDADASVADSVDPDIVLTTGSDADSSGGNVATKEPIVPGNSTEKASTGSEKESKPLKAFNKRRPKFINPGSYLNPELQNLFELGYFGGGKELIPSGWNVVDEDKAYPSLASRMPQVPSTVDDSLNGFEAGNGQAQSDSSGDDDNFATNGFSNQTRMNDEESSDEDELAQSSSGPHVLPVRQRSGVRVGFNKRRPRGLKTYSRKGMQRASKYPQINDDLDEDNQDLGPLIRLGEGIIVDWNVSAYNTVYESDGPEDTFRGRDTISHMPTLPDPLLDAKRTARNQRRKNGITLDDCLNEFGKEEILSEMDTWYCPRCKEHRRASKRFELWKTPDILVMHLKRFSSSAMRRDKLDVMVDFPIEGLDLTPRVVETQEGKEEIYDLFAVDDHWGGLGGGHYTAFAKNFHDGEWYEYNDSSVARTKNPKAVVTQSAYLLFYRRRSEVPLGGPRFQDIIRKYDNDSDSLEDDATGSGEDRGLVGNTFRGSSSALTGVGAAHHRPNPGSDSTEMTTVHPASLESLPAYQAHEDNDDDAAPLLVGDAMMHDALHDSIEDEGIDVGGMNYNNVGYSSLNGKATSSFITGNWSFDTLATNSRGQISGTGSDMDGADDTASDCVQHNSSASQGSMRARFEDFADTMAEDEDGTPFIDQSPVPDMDESGQISQISLHHDILENMVPIKVTAATDEEAAEESATEIHIIEGDEDSDPSFLGS